MHIIKININEDLHRVADRRPDQAEVRQAGDGARAPGVREQQDLGQDLQGVQRAGEEVVHGQVREAQVDGTTSVGADEVEVGELLSLAMGLPISEVA